jgi:hypothetical protein
MINMDDNIVTGKQRQEHYSLPIFQAVSIVPKEIYSSLPTTIVLDKFGIMRLRHEGFANYGKTLIFR